MAPPHYQSRRRGCAWSPSTPRPRPPQADPWARVPRGHSGLVRPTSSGGRGARVCAGQGTTVAGDRTPAGELRQDGECSGSGDRLQGGQAMLHAGPRGAAAPRQTGVPELPSGPLRRSQGMEPWGAQRPRRASRWLPTGTAGPGSRGGVLEENPKSEGVYGLFCISSCGMFLFIRFAHFYCVCRATSPLSRVSLYPLPESPYLPGLCSAP